MATGSRGPQTHAAYEARCLVRFHLTRFGQRSLAAAHREACRTFAPAVGCISWRPRWSPLGRAGRIERGMHPTEAQLSGEDPPPIQNGMVARPVTGAMRGLVRQARSRLTPESDRAGWAPPPYPHSYFRTVVDWSGSTARSVSTRPNRDFARPVAWCARWCTASITSTNACLGFARLPSHTTCFRPDSRGRLPRFL